MARRGKGKGGGGVGDAAWRRGSARSRLVVVSAVAWALLLLAFHLWSCTSPSAYFLSGQSLLSRSLSCRARPVPAVLPASSLLLVDRLIGRSMLLAIALLSYPRALTCWDERVQCGF